MTRAFVHAHARSAAAWRSVRIALPRLVGFVAVLSSMTACVSPSRARYLAGGYASLEDSAEIDGACRLRVANTRIEPREQTIVPVDPTELRSPASPDEAPPARPPPPPSGVVGVTIDAGPLGRLRVVGRAPLVSRAEVPVTVPLAQLELRPPQPVRGFLFGVDLRAYKRIAFIIDSGGNMCEQVPGRPLAIDRATDELIAAISGLPAETSFVLLGTASGIRNLAPSPGDNGRRAAMQWSCNLFCSGNTSLAMALLDAFAEKPDVVVAISTDGASYKSGVYSHDAELDLQLLATDPENVLDRVAGAVPIIAIDLGAGSPHLAAIAEKTGGIVVRP